MSDWEEIVATEGAYRVKLVIDDSGTEPYNDGGSPLLRFSGYSYGNVEQVTGITSYVVPNNIITAAQQLDKDTFARFLRIFHGATTVEFCSSPQYNSDGFVTFDTAHWRDAMGLTDADLIPGQKYADMDEWKAYCEGEVYGIVVERSEPAKADRAQLDAVREQTDATATYDQVVAVADMLATDEDNVWVEVDAIYGYYGTDYAEQSARETLSTYITKAS